jgi:hypothetical protein
MTARPPRSRGKGKLAEALDDLVEKIKDFLAPAPLPAPVPVAVPPRGRR